MSTVWMLPKIIPVWGAPFKPSSIEIKDDVDAAVKVSVAKIMPKKDVVGFVAPHFNVDDVGQALEDLDEESQQAMADQQRAAVDMMALTDPNADGGQDQPRTQAGNSGGGPARKARKKNSQSAAQG